MTGPILASLDLRYALIPQTQLHRAASQTRREGNSSAKTFSPLLGGPEAFAEQERALKTRLCELIDESSLMESVERWQLKREPVHRFHLGVQEKLGDRTVLAPLLRSRQAWRASLQKQGKLPSAAGETLSNLSSTGISQASLS